MNATKLDSYALRKATDQMDVEWHNRKQLHQWVDHHAFTPGEMSRLRDRVIIPVVSHVIGSDHQRLLNLVESERVPSSPFILDVEYFIGKEFWGYIKVKKSRKDSGDAYLMYTTDAKWIGLVPADSVGDGMFRSVLNAFDDVMSLNDWGLKYGAPSDQWISIKKSTPVFRPATRSRDLGPPTSLSKPPVPPNYPIRSNPSQSEAAVVPESLFTGGGPFKKKTARSVEPETPSGKKTRVLWAEAKQMNPWD